MPLTVAPELGYHYEDIHSYIHIPSNHVFTEAYIHIDMFTQHLVMLVYICGSIVEHKLTYIHAGIYT